MKDRIKISPEIAADIAVADTMARDHINNELQRMALETDRLITRDYTQVELDKTRDNMMRNQAVDTLARHIISAVLSITIMLSLSAIVLALAYKLIVWIMVW